MLSYTNRRHVSTEILQAASRDIINAYNPLSLPKCWGSGTRAAADGSKFEIYVNNLLSEYHIRYGGYGGIAYHHVSDKYIALFTHFIACGVWEAVYILDGLLKNTSDIQPDTLHADTQGQSTPVFALSYLLGIKLMPRIRNWQDLTFFRPTQDAKYQYIDPLFKGVVDWKLIQTHWQDLMRVVLSIKAGKLMPSTILRKLGSYSRKNRLYQAFRELGQVVRTVLLLQYTAVCGFMGYSYLQKPHSERGREFKVSSICLRTAVYLTVGCAKKSLPARTLWKDTTIFSIGCSLGKREL